VADYLHGQQLANIGCPFPSAPEKITSHVVFLKALPQEEVNTHYHLQPSIMSNLFPATVKIGNYCNQLEYAELDEEQKGVFVYSLFLSL
jgi:hypothetical protein